MKNKLLFSIYLAGILVLPSFAFAQITVQSIIGNIVNNVVWPIAVGIIVILWIITGVLFLTALGAPEKVGTAKKALFASLAGTIIIILANSVVVIIRTSLGI